MHASGELLFLRRKFSISRAPRCLSRSCMARCRRAFCSSSWLQMLPGSTKSYSAGSGTWSRAPTTASHVICCQHCGFREVFPVAPTRKAEARCGSWLWPGPGAHFPLGSRMSASPDGPAAQEGLQAGPSGAAHGTGDARPPAQPAAPPGPASAPPSAQGSWVTWDLGGSRGRCMPPAPSPHHPASWLRAWGAGRWPPNAAANSHHQSHSLGLRGVAAP